MKKVSDTGVFCEFGRIFKNTFFTELLQVTASASVITLQGSTVFKNEDLMKINNLVTLQANIKTGTLKT